MKKIELLIVHCLLVVTFILSFSGAQAQEALVASVATANLDLSPEVGEDSTTVSFVFGQAVKPDHETKETRTRFNRWLWLGGFESHLMDSDLGKISSYHGIQSGVLYTARGWLQFGPVGSFGYQYGFKGNDVGEYMHGGWNATAAFQIRLQWVAKNYRNLVVPFVRCNFGVFMRNYTVDTGFDLDPQDPNQKFMAAPLAQLALGAKLKFKYWSVGVEVGNSFTFINNDLLMDGIDPTPMQSQASKDAGQNFPDYHAEWLPFCNVILEYKIFTPGKYAKRHRVDMRGHY